MNASNSDNDFPFLCSWSGGKDSYFAMFKAVAEGGVPKVLLNVLNEHGERSRSHGIPREVLLAQAQCVNVPLAFIASTWKNYEENFIVRLKELTAQYEVTAAVFGDIDIASHRVWEEKVSHAAGLQPMLPLWQGAREALVKEMIHSGIRALIVSCQAPYAEHILGRYIDEPLLEVFAELGIDACGENGEYHTLVVDGPLHQQVLPVSVGEVQTHNNYAFLTLAKA